MECEIPPGAKEISLLFTDDQSIRILNRDYRKKDKATDVLSFPQIDFTKKDDSSPTLGDIVISVETARKQARKYLHSLNREIERLLVHGVLHLLGYDHEKVPQSEARRMRRREKQLLAIL